MKSEFSKNLKELAARKGSTAQICREIGMAPQQFNKYINGSTYPTPHTLARICSYFKVTEADLLLRHDEFVSTIGSAFLDNPAARKIPFLKGFSEGLAQIRPYLGAYQVYYCSPAWPDKILVAASFIDERDGIAHMRTLERGHAPLPGGLNRSRYKGLATMLEGRIFIVEYEAENDGAITETILYKPHRQESRYLKGMTLGLAWRPRRSPFSAKTIWRKAQTTQSAREVLRECGVYSKDHPKIDAIVKKYLFEPTNG